MNKKKGSTLKPNQEWEEKKTKKEGIEKYKNKGEESGKNEKKNRLLERH